MERGCEQVMTAMMADNQAPPEAFTRLGLAPPHDGRNAAAAK